MRICGLFLICILLFSHGPVALGQSVSLQVTYPGLDRWIDKTFTPHPIITKDGQVFYVGAAKAQLDGKILLINLSQDLGFIRVNSDGALDESFKPQLGPGFNNYWYDQPIEVQSDGKILIGYSYSFADQTNRSVLVRLLPDGSRDPSFTVTENLDNVTDGYATSVQMLLQSDGRIIIPQYSPDGKSIDLLRLNSDGSLDPSFQAHLGDLSSNFDLRITLALQPDGRLLAAGNFTHVNNLSKAGLVRLLPDGKIDSSFNLVPPFNTNAVQGAWIAHDGKLFVKFTGNGIRRFLSDGKLDVNFEYLSDAHHGDPVPILELSNGTWLFSLAFGFAYGDLPTKVSVNDSNGSVDLLFNRSGAVFTLLPDGKLLMFARRNVNGVGNEVVRLLTLPPRPLGLTSPVRDVGGQVRLVMEARPFVNYGLQASSDLTTWFSSGQIPQDFDGDGSGGLYGTVPEPGNIGLSKQRFYRAVEINL